MKAKPSLRLRLLAAVSVASALVLVSAGVALYLLVRTSLLKEMDLALVQQARVMTSMFEWKDGRVDLELDQLTTPGRPSQGNLPYFEVWQEGLGLLARSASLAGDALAQRTWLYESPSWSFVKLSALGRVRMVAITVRPPAEGGGESDAKPTSNPAPRVTLLLASDLRRFEASLARLVFLLVAVGLAAMLASTGGAMWAVGFGLRPLEVLGQRLAGLDEASLHSRVELPKSPKELISVVERLNQLLERLEAAFGREKALLANLAHELRTPLAGLGFTLEVGLSRPRPAEAYAADMRQCLDICRQMQGMVDNLLTMARLDAGHGQSQERLAVDLEEMLRQAWASCQDQARQKGLELEWEPTPGTHAWAEPHGLLIIFRNILANAVEYADRNGRIRIQVFAERGRVVVRVGNTGCNLAPEDMDRVFERFWRGDSARGGDQAHAGLGLALSRQLAEGMGASLAASQDEQDRFWITLSLPIGSAAEIMSH